MSDYPALACALLSMLFLLAVGCLAYLHEALLALKAIRDATMALVATSIGGKIPDGLQDAAWRTVARAADLGRGEVGNEEALAQRGEQIVSGRS